MEARRWRERREGIRTGERIEMRKRDKREKEERVKSCRANDLSIRFESCVDYLDSFLSTFVIG